MCRVEFKKTYNGALIHYKKKGGWCGGGAE